MNFTEAFERSMLDANKDLLIDNEFENIISTIREAHEDIDFNMSILDEMTKIQADYEALNESSGPAEPPIGGPKPEEDKSPRDNKYNNEHKFDSSLNNDIQKRLEDLMKKIAARGVGYNDRSTYSDESLNYTPTGGITTVKTMSDMKFPENIKFFIETIVKWLKNLIAFALKAIKNLIKIICGAEVDKDEMKDAKEKLHMEFKKSKTYHALGTPIVGSKPGPVQMRVFNNPSELQKIGIIEESMLYEDDRTSGPVVISIDTSKDILALKEFVNHFFKLYDNAFGSNEEFLFGTEDVELLLRAFNTMRENLEKGNIATYSIAGRAMELDMIDADRMRDAAIKTKINVDALSKAYGDTFTRIQDILKVVQSKSLISSVNNVTSFKILSHATAGTALDIINAIEPRIKEATILEKRLNKVQDMYEKLIKSLQKNMSIIGSFGKVTYVSQYQSHVTNLFNSARYTSQIISMRISALALYLKELKDLKEMLKILTNFSSL